MNRFDIAAKDAQDIIRAAFPSYRKRNATIEARTAVTLQDLNWSGGTKSEYAAVRLADGRAVKPSLDRDPPWTNRHEGARVDMVPGIALVRAGWFCGKASTVTIYVHPDDLARTLPAPR